MSKSIRRITILAGRNVKEILRDPLSLIFLIGMPLGMEIMFYFIFHNMTDQFNMKYLAPGIVVFAQAFLTLFSGLLIAVDRGSAFLTRLYVSRAKPFEFIAGYFLALLPITLCQSVLFFAVGCIIDSSIFGIGMLYSILLSVVTSLLFISLGILLGSLCNEKSIGGVASVIIAGQSMLSGMWFPQEGLSGGMVTLMKVLPFKNATDLVQGALNGISDMKTGLIIPLLIVLGYAVVSFIAAVLVFGRKMKSN